MGKQVKRRLPLFITFVCLLAFFSMAASASSQKAVDHAKRVLIINSYHKGYPWTDSTIAGIESVLKDGKNNIELHFEFMDGKSGEDKSRFNRLFQLYRSKFTSLKFDLIIVADNDAVNFILKYKDALFPNVPVVFCGVSVLHEVLQMKPSLVTGVTEHYDLKTTLEVALKLHPEAKEVIAVNNATPIGAVKRRLFNEAVAATGKNLKSTIVDDPVLPDFERLIKDKKKDFLVLLLGSFKDKKGSAVPIEESTPILARSDVPLYAGHELYLGHGIIGGKLISGYGQGALAAKIALRILQGEPVEKIPIDHNSPNAFMFDYNPMKKFGIDQGALPEGSVVINALKAIPQPPSLPAHSDNAKPWVVIVVLACLGIVAVLVVFFIRSKRGTEESIDKLAVDQEKKVEAKTDELVRANADLRSKISEMKNAEASLTESQLKHWTLFQSAPNPVFIIDEDARFSDCNARMLEFYECTLDELRTMDARQFIPEHIFAPLIQSTEHPAPIKTFETKHVVHGKGKALLLNLVPVVLSGKRFVYGTGQEITDMKREHDVAQSREECLKKVINTLKGALMISGRDGAVEYVSEGFTTAVGYTLEDIPVMDIWWHKAYPEKTERDTVSGVWAQSAIIKEPNGESVQSIESKVTTKDGRIVDKILIFINVRELIAMVIHDAREKKLSETRVPVSRNQEPIETLAAGIAHDFNNLLLVILGNISLAKTGLKREDRSFERLLDAERASMMTKDLIQQLITFSKGGELSKRAMVITPLIMEITRSALSGSNIKGKYIMSDDLFPVEIDESQIRQVMNIILRNAREAMPKGGTITVTFENVNIAREDYLPLKNGDYVRISFQDEGLGIKKEHIERVFDPYFTTKDVGSQKGVGLGLAIAYSIIKKHSGHIAVESNLGGGTIFHVYLPAYGKEINSSQEYEERFFEPTKRKGRVLVMDDARAVRDVTGAMLSHIGYDAGFAQDGREAIAIYREAQQAEDPFDAVILDLTVQGGMGGKEAIQVLLATDPHIKAIVSSGYSGDPIMTEYQEYGFKAAILKPYKMEELEEVLERLIRG